MTIWVLLTKAEKETQPIIRFEMVIKEKHTNSAREMKLFLLAIRNKLFMLRLLLEALNDVAGNTLNNIPGITELAPFPFPLALLHLRHSTDAQVSESTVVALKEMCSKSVALC